VTPCRVVNPSLRIGGRCGVTIEKGNTGPAVGGGRAGRGAVGLGKCLNRDRRFSMVPGGPVVKRFGLAYCYGCRFRVPGNWVSRGARCSKKGAKDRSGGRDRLRRGGKHACGCARRNFRLLRPIADSSRALEVLAMLLSDRKLV